MDHEIEPTRDDNALLPFQDLVAPLPIRATPPAKARWFAFASVLVGGGLAAAVGYGVGDLLGLGSPNWAAGGALFGGLTGAIGVGVVANLTLRAMNEWKAVEHPEAVPVVEATPSDEQPTTD